MIANTSDSSFSSSPDRWWCSGFNDVTTWVPAVSTQCASGRLIDTPGDIRGLKNLGDLMIAYKERSIYIGRYVGAPSVFNWTCLPGEIGCASQEAIANIGYAHIFPGRDDFYYFDGTRPQAIGAAVRDWFNNDQNTSYRYRIQAYHDKATANVFFHYVSRRSTSGALDACIIYNYKSQKWGLAHRTVETVLEYVSNGVTWDNLSSVASTWDTLPDVSYDSPFWNAGAEVYAYFDADHTLKQVSGPSLASYLVTGDFGDDEVFSTLQQVRPRFFDKPDATIGTHYYRNDLGDDLTTGTTSTMTDGRIDFLQSARWHRVKIDMTGDHEISAIQPRMIANGTA